jgi:hypothetical protein
MALYALRSKPAIEETPGPQASGERYLHDPFTLNWWNIMRALPNFFINARGFNVIKRTSAFTSAIRQLPITSRGELAPETTEQLSSEWRQVLLNDGSLFCCCSGD